MLLPMFPQSGSRRETSWPSVARVSAASSTAATTSGRTWAGISNRGGGGGGGAPHPAGGGAGPPRNGARGGRGPPRLRRAAAGQVEVEGGVGDRAADAAVDRHPVPVLTVRGEGIRHQRDAPALRLQPVDT